jgi:hypothetical protein
MDHYTIEQMLGEGSMVRCSCSVISNHRFFVDSSFKLTFPFR